MPPPATPAAPEKKKTPIPLLTPAEEDARGWRETVESLVVALILAMLIRTFEAEAFVIPTGSMAPTLMGAHKDVACPKCGFWYQVGDSDRSADQREEVGDAIFGTCPMCAYKQYFNPKLNIEQSTFSGDRILVNKYAYDFVEPQRWDVIVFKYPNNPKINYIKRLVGLPGETIHIWHGDVYTKVPGTEKFEIQRKAPHRLLAMLQNVHDTQFIPQALIDVNWPSRWETLPGSQVNWKVEDGGRRFTGNAAAGNTAILAYQHQTPSQEVWDKIDNSEPIGAVRPRSRLIRDFYAYNSTSYQKADMASRFNRNWVGDLAVEVEVEVKSDKGLLDLILIEAGRHHRCRINLADGQAELSIEPVDHQPVPFDNDAGGEEGTRKRILSTAVRGPGHYSLRWANVDNELTLWVNGSPLVPVAKATYEPPTDERPYYRAPDPSTGDAGDLGDLAPVRIGITNTEVQINRLRVLRDIYYIAVSKQTHDQSEYDHSEYGDGNFPGVNDILDTPEKWANTTLFASRRHVEFTMQDDQFFPMGDNSPYSKDARVWGTPDERNRYSGDLSEEHFFRREMLIGRAFVVYFPHTWYTIRVGSWPLMPNFGKMRRIQ